MPKCLHVWTCGAFRLDHVLQGHVLGIRSGRTCWSRHVGVYIHRKTPWPGRLVYFIFSEPNWEFSLCHYTPCYTPCMFRTVKSYPRVWAKNTCSTYSSHFQPFSPNSGPSTAKHVGTSCSSASLWSAGTLNQAVFPSLTFHVVSHLGGGGKTFSPIRQSPPWFVRTPSFQEPLINLHHLRS